AVIAVAVIGAAGIMALRSTASTPVAQRVATAVGVAFALAVVLFAGAELVLLTLASGDEARTVVTMSALSIAGFGCVVWRSRLGLTPSVTAAITAVAFGLSALLVYGVAPVELVTVAPAIATTALGVRALRRNPQARSWPTLGPGLALLTLPSLAYDFFGDVELWRVVTLGVVALALVVTGAVLRLQAPLVLGSAVLLVHGVSQLWPWISTAYEYVPWWLWLGIGGILLIYLAARYEKNMRAVRTAFTAVTSLR
ncbi:MAG: SCO7613 C-terminal domain-containing membrane protein, partial [Microbacterium sp.]